MLNNHVCLINRVYSIIAACFLIIIYNVCLFLDLECIFMSNFVALFLFISTFPLDNWKPLCSRQFAFDAINKPNLFCGITGWFTVV